MSKTPQNLLTRNRKWAARITADDPGFFSRLAKIQKPDYLWIGCADSRVPASQITDLAPGEVFVHRNIANVVVHTDLNCLSVIQFAVEVLKVRHIIVCGHYGCGGVKAALDKQPCGLIDNWLRHIHDVERRHADELNGLPEAERFPRLCELNVIEQVRNVQNTPVVQNALRGGTELHLHGWIYDIRNGILEDLLNR